MSKNIKTAKKLVVKPVAKKSVVQAAKSSKKISYAGVNSLAGVARAIGMDPKNARGKRRRHLKSAPSKKLQGLSTSEASAMGTWLQQDLRTS